MSRTEYLKEKGYLVVKYRNDHIGDEITEFHLPINEPKRLVNLAREVRRNSNKGYDVLGVLNLSRQEYLLARVNFYTSNYLEAVKTYQDYEGQNNESERCAASYVEATLEQVCRSVRRCIRANVDIDNEMAIQVFNYANQ